jgi:hypothetical protein
LRNKFEEEIYKQLVRKYGKANVGYEQRTLPYYTSHNYVCDFVVEQPDVGGYFLVEAKGYFRPEDRPKMRAVKEQYPELDIRLIFFQDNKLGKNARCSDWAEKYGFKYAIGKVPKDW